MKRILIDGRFIGVGESMTRYCLEIVKGILELDKENEYTLLVRPIGEQLIQNSKIKNQNDNFKIKILDVAHYSLSEQTKLLKYLDKERFDLVHFIQFNHPVRYRGEFVVTIHDLTLFGHLHRKDHLRRLGFGAVMKSAVKNSAKIITISETTKQDILDNYRVEPEKIAVTHLGVDGAYNAQVKSQKSKVKSFRDKYGISGEYLLYTGMWKKHKNLIGMLKAYEVLIQNSKIKNQNDISKLKIDEEPCHCEERATKQSTLIIPQLVLVGRVDESEKEVVELIRQINSYTKKLKPKAYPPVVTTGFIDEEELPLAYAGALAYVIPSLSEGFGLPPLEAMACGTPVLSSNISAMPEILGEAPLYFDPYNIEDMADKILQAVSNEQLRASLAAKGLEQAKKYSWGKTASQTLKVYEDCLR